MQFLQNFSFQYLYYVIYQCPLFVDKGSLKHYQQQQQKNQKNTINSLKVKTLICLNTFFSQNTYGYDMTSLNEINVPDSKPFSCNFSFKIWAQLKLLNDGKVG